MHDLDLWPGVRDDRRTVVHVARRGDGGSDTRLERAHDLDDARAVADDGPVSASDLASLQTYLMNKYGL